MLEDARPALLLTHSSLRSNLGARSSSIPLLCLDSDWGSMVANQPTIPPASTTQPLNLAYVIYTSGSTGTPKGVLIPHRNVLNMAQNVQRTLAIEPGSRVLQFFSIGFDAASCEIVTTLLSGATLVLASSEQLLPGLNLMYLLAEQHISTLSMTPSALAALSSLSPETVDRSGAPTLGKDGPASASGTDPTRPALEALPTVKTLAVGGEVCPAAAVTRWAPGRRLDRKST